MKMLVVLALCAQLNTSAKAETPVVAADKPKSIVKAALLSGLLPGAGEYYAKSPNRARLFLATEALVWGAYLGFTYYGRRVRDDYRAYASSQAGADLSLHSEEYYNAMEQYSSSEDYNTDVRREARMLYPDDPERQLAYYREKGYFGDQEWEWEDESVWIEYRELRVKSRSAFQRAIYMTGLAVLNRGLSIIDSFYLVKAYNEKSIGLEIKPELDHRFTIHKFKIGIVARFY